MENQNKLKHRVLEVLEGGIRGNTAARIFSWTLIVLILLSITFMVIWDLDGMERWHEIFEIIETVTIGIFTLELILGFWTADVRFPAVPQPRITYLIQFMTIVQMLAIQPFYLGILLQNTWYEEVAEFFELLKLLHLLKILEIGVHAWKEGEKSDQ